MPALTLSEYRNFAAFAIVTGAVSVAESCLASPSGVPTVMPAELPACWAMPVEEAVIWPSTEPPAPTNAAETAPASIIPPHRMPPITASTWAGPVEKKLRLSMPSWPWVMIPESVVIGVLHRHGVDDGVDHAPRGDIDEEPAYEIERLLRQRRGEEDHEEGNEGDGHGRHHRLEDGKPFVRGHARPYEGRARVPAREDGHGKARARVEEHVVHGLPDEHLLEDVRRGIGCPPGERVDHPREGIRALGQFLGVRRVVAGVRAGGFYGVGERGRRS